MYHNVVRKDQCTTKASALLLMLRIADRERFLSLPIDGAERRLYVPSIRGFGYMLKLAPKAVKLTVLALFAALVLVGAAPTWVLAGSAGKKINSTWLGVAIKGYDAVAYFTEGRAVKGKKQFEFKWQDARWRFASTANRDLFAADPEAYAPQYGGF
jgi:hypothetical protein